MCNLQKMSATQVLLMNRELLIEWTLFDQQIYYPLSPTLFCLIFVLNFKAVLVDRFWTVKMYLDFEK